MGSVGKYMLRSMRGNQGFRPVISPCILEIAKVAQSVNVLMAGCCSPGITSPATPSPQVSMGSFAWMPAWPPASAWLTKPSRRLPARAVTRDLVDLLSEPTDWKYPDWSVAAPEERSGEILPKGYGNVIFRQLEGTTIFATPVIYLTAVNDVHPRAVGRYPSCAVSAEARTSTSASLELERSV